MWVIKWTRLEYQDKTQHRVFSILYLGVLKWCMDASPIRPQQQLLRRPLSGSLTEASQPLLLKCIFHAGCGLIFSFTSGLPTPHLFTLVLLSCACSTLTPRPVLPRVNCSETYGDLPPYGCVLLLASETALPLCFLDDLLHARRIITWLNPGQCLQMWGLFYVFSRSQTVESHARLKQMIGFGFSKLWPDRNIVNYTTSLHIFLRFEHKNKNTQVLR